MKRFYIGVAVRCMVMILPVSTFGQNDAIPKAGRDTITLKDFNARVGNRKKPVLVYFSADWCMACIRPKPVIDRTEKQFAGKIDVLTIDTERDKEVNDEFEINTLPVLMLYQGGYRAWIYVGYLDDMELQRKIECYLY